MDSFNKIEQLLKNYDNICEDYQTFSEHKQIETLQDINRSIDKMNQKFREIDINRNQPKTKLPRVLETENEDQDSQFIQPLSRNVSYVNNDDQGKDENEINENQEYDKNKKTESYVQEFEEEEEQQ
ncbi:hypothetical protein pb186bvf_012451 [Paramecium bursaria]